MKKLFILFLFLFACQKEIIAPDYGGLYVQRTNISDFSAPYIVSDQREVKIYPIDKYVTFKYQAESDEIIRILKSDGQYLLSDSIQVILKRSPKDARQWKFVTSWTISGTRRKFYESEPMNLKFNGYDYLILIFK